MFLFWESERAASWAALLFFYEENLMKALCTWRGYGILDGEGWGFDKAEVSDMFGRIMRNIRFDLRRGVRSPFLYLANALTIILLCVGVFFNSGRFGEHDVDWTMRFVLAITGMSALLPLVVSLLCTLTHSAWHRMDIASGFVRYRLSRTDRRSYVLARCVSAFVLGVMSVAGALLICMGGCRLMFPSQPTIEEWLPVFLFSEVYLHSPVIYCLLLIGNTCLYAGVYSMAGMAVSALSGKAYTAIIGPFALSLAMHVFFCMIGYLGLSPLSLIMLEFNAKTTATQIYGEALAMAVACMTVFALCSKREVVL